MERLLVPTRWKLAFAIGAVVPGCVTASQLEGRIQGARDLVQEAEENGAYRCAPRTLAMAKAHLEFAEAELAQGHGFRAQAHFDVAEPHARAALTRSPADRCAPRAEIEAEAPPGPGDRDGDGLPDPSDECPVQPEDFDGWDDEDGCPEDQDVDGDGVADSRDQCTLEPEDADGYLDEDGCPELDDDLDGLADDEDGCRLEPEDRDGYRDGDGCPDLDNDVDSVPDVDDRCPNAPGPVSEQGCPRVYQDVEVTETAIRITQQVHFEFNRARIRPESYGLLNTVAQALRDYPEIRVEVQGHTDSRGSDPSNLRLSQERAEAVVQFLVAAGIDPTRLSPRGYGESRPIESNRTSAGRAANRRVEFVRTDQAAQEQQP